MNPDRNHKAEKHKAAVGAQLEADQVREQKNALRGSKYFFSAERLPHDAAVLSALTSWAQAEGDFRSFLYVNNEVERAELDPTAQTKYDQLEQAATAADKALKQAIPDVNIQHLSASWIDKETDEAGHLTLALY